MRRNQATALVIGGSLAGLMSAISLSEAGVKVIVLERFPKIQRRGATLSVHSNYKDINELAQKLRFIASGVRRGVESWRAIQRRLREASEHTSLIETFYEATVVNITQEKDKVTVETQLGEIFEADFLIGADGRSSYIRQVVNPEQPHAKFAGYLLWVGIVEEEEMPSSAWASAYASSFESISGEYDDFLFGLIVPGYYDSIKRGERQIGLAWYDNSFNDLLYKTKAVENGIVRNSLTTRQINETVLKQLKTRANKYFPEPFRTAVSIAIDKGYLTATPVAEYVPTKLVNHRIALVGDAAHALTPMTARGFNSSLEDAAILGAFIKEYVNNNISICEALIQYEKNRLPIVRKIVQSGQSFSESFAR